MAISAGGVGWYADAPELITFHGAKYDKMVQAGSHLLNRDDVKKAGPGLLRRIWQKVFDWGSGPSWTPIDTLLNYESLMVHEVSIKRFLPRHVSSLERTRLINIDIAHAHETR